MRKDYLSVGDPELLAFSSNFASKIQEDPESCGLSESQAAEYLSLHETFADALTLAKDPITRTRAAIAGKNAARARLKRLARALARIAKASGIPTAKCIELGLQPDNPSRARYPRPREAPVLEVVAARGRQFTITLRGKDQLRARRPRGVGGAVVMSYVGDTPPADVSRWTFQSAITRTRLRIHLPASVPPGATVWLCGRWNNYREQPGPASTPVQTFVAGAIAPG